MDLRCELCARQIDSEDLECAVCHAVLCDRFECWRPSGHFGTCTRCVEEQQAERLRVAEEASAELER